MISISCDHPDIEEFITIKSDLNKITKANLSIRVTDKFMQAVDYDTTYTLSYVREETGEKIERKIRAKELFDKFCYMNWDYAEPAFLFWDRIKSYNLLSEDDAFEYAGVNPCLTGDTIIAVADGRNGVSIKELCNTTFPIYSARFSKHSGKTVKGDNWVTEVKKAKAFKSGTKHVITLKLSDGSEFRCTPNHKIALANGDYKEAQYCLGEQVGKFFTFSDKNTHKNYRHINSFTSNRQYRYIADYYKILTQSNHTIHHIDGNATTDNPNNLASILFDEHMKEMGECRKKDNPITRDINYQFNQGLRNITANGKRYGWSEEKIQNAKEAYIKNHQHIYVEKIDNNCYLNDVVYITNIIDNNEVEDVYDISVEDNHNFYIITNTDDDKYLNCSGLLVHNCAEEPLPSGGSCLLGSLNLSAFVETIEGQPQFNMDEFRKAVTIAVYGLNDVLDEGISLHPLSVQRDSVYDWRQIGLGIMGLADMLIKLGVTYGSKESLKICDDIGWNLANEALSTSITIAKNKGEYPMFSDKVWESEFYKNHIGISAPLRNSQLLTIAPTGTLSTMLGISGGIEPIFANYYTRKTESLHGEDKEYKIFTPIAWEYLQSHGYGEDETKLPDYFVTSAEIAYRDRINMQAIWQTHIDASISSTVNLPNSATIDDVKDLYMYAWECGLKGITVFRDGCKRLGVLTTDTNEDEVDDDELSITSLPRGVIEEVSDDLISAKRTIVNGCGKMYLHLDFDENTGQPLETFLECSSGGGCERNLTFISRLMSLALRGGVPIEAIIDQAFSVKPCKAYCDRRKKFNDTSKGNSCPQAIGYALVELNKKIQDRCFADDDGYEYDELTVDVPHASSNLPPKEIRSETGKGNDDIIYNDDAFCPECGAKLQHQGGCVICVGDATHAGCGWSRCG